MSNKKVPWGYHLIIDAAECDKMKISDAGNIYNFVKDLVDKIDMKAFGEPIIECFATHDPSKGGYSLVQLIETSNICCHFVDLSGDAYLDVFSCKSFENSVVVECFEEYFSPRSMKINMIERNA